MNREPTDEQLRAMLAVQWPALYKDGLHHPMDGPGFSKENEARIDMARKMYAAAFVAPTTLDTGQMIRLHKRLCSTEYPDGWGWIDVIRETEKDHGIK